MLSAYFLLPPAAAHGRQQSWPHVATSQCCRPPHTGGDDGLESLKFDVFGISRFAPKPVDRQQL